MITPKPYLGGDLTGSWLVTRKLDGIRMLRQKGTDIPVSRANKPLYGLQDVPVHIRDAEVFLGSWEETASVLKTKSSSSICDTNVYSLNPLDDRLIIGTYEGLTEQCISNLLEQVVSQGDEGLVLYKSADTVVPTSISIKVKPKQSFDLEVLDVIEGQGKRKGKVGKVVTSLGNVGVFRGFDQGLLSYYWNNKRDLIGKIAEFECVSLTPSGKMRHAVMTRIRFDKEGSNEEL